MTQKSSPAAIRLSWPEPGIARLGIDLPGKGVNVLSRVVLGELSAALDEIEAADDLVGVIVISDKQSSFLAGADLREFAAAIDSRRDQVIERSQRGQALLARLARLPGVSVAAIHGACLGGGAELACWCDRRVLSNDAATIIGFPEVKLGLHPGWGGTVRLPRLVGLGNAVELITSGETIDAERAAAMGLANCVCRCDQLEPAAMRLIRLEQKSGNYVHDRKRSADHLRVNETELEFLGATASAVIRQKTKGHYPAPAFALELMLESAAENQITACRRESESLAELFGSPVNQALLNVFFLTDRNKRDMGELAAKSNRDIQCVGVVGAGVMGQGIAAACLRRDMQVVLHDSDPAALGRSAEAVLVAAAYDRTSGGPSVENSLKYGGRLHATTDLGDLHGCDLIIEAIVEDIDAKRRLLAELETRVGKETVLATNTSTIPVAVLAEALEQPERFCGVHFFNPVRSMKLVEVVRGPVTSGATMATAVAWARRLDKTPVVVADGPGFLVNRILSPYLGAALQLVGEGADLKQIDRAAREFGMPLGPLELLDVVGLDTALRARKGFAAAADRPFVGGEILHALVAAGRVGKKAGRGFYRYDNRQERPVNDPAVAGILAGCAVAAGAGPAHDREQVIDRLILPMVVAAAAALEAQVVHDPRDVDLALILGVGFPAFRGGLLYWADQVGAQAIVKRLQPFETISDGYKPPLLVGELAVSGRRFYNVGAGAPAF